MENRKRIRLCFGSDLPGPAEGAAAAFPPQLLRVESLFLEDFSGRCAVLASDRFAQDSF